jgi:branched-chain amino acid transport system permease protein
VTQQTDAVASPGMVPRRGRMSRATRLRALNERTSQAFPFALIAAIVAAVFYIAANSGGNVAVSQLENGIAIGAVYALIAVGYTMVYGIIELINFAHGDVFTLSAVYSLYFQQGFASRGFDLDSLAKSNIAGFFAALIILLILSMLAAGITGVLIERVAYRRLRNSPRLAPLITAIGVSFLLEGVMFATKGSSNFPTNRTDWISGTAFTIGSVDISWTNVFVVVMAILMMVLLQLFVGRTRLGKAMRATAQDRDAALLSGININQTIAATFFIGSALAAAGAIVYSIKERALVWSLGFNFGVIAFTSAVLGGIGNIVGAGLGGFLIGLIQNLGGQIIGFQWSNTLVFVMLIVVLTFRPVGLLGMRVPDRA